MTTHPLSRQAGGGHYTSLQIQPVQFSMANRLDACAHSVCKYVTRHHAKNGLLDLQKAFHFVELRESLCDVSHRVIDWPITPEEYCRANNLPILETAVIIGVGLWLSTGHLHFADEVKSVLTELMATYGEDNDAC